jgi:hypothetical protein
VRYLMLFKQVKHLTRAKAARQDDLVALSEGAAKHSKPAQSV